MEYSQYFATKGVAERLRHYPAERTALEQVGDLIRSAMGEAEDLAGKKMAEKDIEGEKLARVRAAAFRESLSYLTVTEYRYLPHDAPVPEGWQRTDSLPGCHHGDYADIIVPQTEKPKLSIAAHMKCLMAAAVNVIKSAK